MARMTNKKRAQTNKQLWEKANSSHRQRWQVLNILEHNGDDYNHVLDVDADSIVHPDCPNFFEMTNNKFTTVLTDGDYEWVNRAINGYSKLFFNKCFLG